MSVSLKNMPKISEYFSKKDAFILKPIIRDKSIEKPKKYLNLKNIFYKQEKLLQTKLNINKDLPILNFISISSQKQSSNKTSLTDTAPNIFNYDICMINKYDENLNSSLSFISQFGLEEDVNNLAESFDSSNNENNCEEQIEIKTSSKYVFQDKDKETNERLDKEWNDIKNFLLNKESFQ